MIILSYHRGSRNKCRLGVRDHHLPPPFLGPRCIAVVSKHGVKIFRKIISQYIVDIGFNWKTVQWSGGAESSDHAAPSPPHPSLPPFQPIICQHLHMDGHKATSLDHPIHPTSSPAGSHTPLPATDYSQQVCEADGECNQRAWADRQAYSGTWRG